MSLPALDLGALASLLAPASLIAKMTLLLAAGALVQALIGRRVSAATRHLVWTLVVGGVLVLPLVSAMVPTFAVPVAVRLAVPVPAASATAPHTNALPHAPLAVDADAPVSMPAPAAGIERTNAEAAASLAASGPSSSASSASTTSAMPWLGSARARIASVAWTTVAFIVYTVGVVALLLVFGAEQWAVYRLTRRARTVDDPEWMALLHECAREMGVARTVRLLRSLEQTMPMTCGTWRPIVLLPAIADTWTDDRRRAVLLHELAHVARHDCLTQRLAAFACALYWLHPGVWLVARRLRVERELACDDRVLTVGTQAREYAGHLLELAYSLGGHRAPALVVSMARPRHLEGRMLAVLDVARNRTTPGLRGRMAGFAITAALLVPIAAAEVTVVSALGDESRGSLATEIASVNEAATSDWRTPSPSPSVSPSPSPSPSPAFSESSSLAQSSSPQDRLPGTWEIRPALGMAGFVHLRMTETDRMGGHWSNGNTIPLATLEGLSQSALSGTDGQVKFNIRRDAGTLTFEGMFRNSVGAGMYNFVPNAAFPQELAKRGIASPNATEQYEMARADVGFAFIDELIRQGYPKPTLAELVRAGHHGVNLEFLKGMTESGYKFDTIDTLIKFRDHGVTPRYIKELTDQGLTKLSADQLLKMRDHGVSADYVREMRASGYGPLSPEQLVRTRDHGVNPEFVKALSQAGYSNLPLDDVINARDHGVSAKFVQELGQSGYSKLSLAQVTKARDHGVSADFVRELAEQGYAKLPLEDIISARDHGVSSKFVRELRGMGYQLSLADVVKARDHGVSTEYVYELKTLGYDKLPIETVIRMRDHGVSASFVRELKELGYENVALDTIVALRDHGVSAERIRRANQMAGTRLPLDMIRALTDGGGIR